ncbi:MAG TPA: rhomboid family intramembrane serine protease [Gammaproteobacteria bacterium]|nr:rhomboid family intramembrane serine protease [Gammaproteobacteria bacterium]
MLIIPIEQKLDSNRPPVATVLLIILNCLVFFGYQQQDQLYLDQAVSFYAENGLLEYEDEVYAEYLKDKDFDRYEEYQELEPEQAGEWIVQDVEFGYYLSHDYFIHHSDAGLEWMDARSRLDDITGQMSFLQYGFIPGQFSLLGMFTYMFLHSGIGHLFGNMLFLFIYGFSLEVALGRLWFCGIYLLSGLAGALLSWAVSPHSLVPIVGASGAIFGLLGMYLGLYGMKKIRFFWSVGFYAHYFTAPALVLLPYWALIELYDQFTSPGMFAHFVHIGGLLAGFAAVYAAKDRLIKIDRGYVDKVDTDEPYKKLYDRLLRQLESIDFSAARKTVQELLQLRPGDARLLKHQFDLWKLKPASEGFESAARQLFTGDPTELAGIRGLQFMAADYEKLSEKRDALGTRERINLFNALLKKGETETALKQLDALSDDPEARAKVPGLMLRLATTYAAQGDKRKAGIYLDKVRDKYPDSEAADEARKIKL